MGRNLLKSHRNVIIVCTWLVVACGDGPRAPGTYLPPPDPGQPGRYPVGVTRIELVDAQRDRTLLTEVWYPAAESARGQEPAPGGSYLPPELAFLADNATLDLVAVRDAPLAPDGPYPIILFSHGSGGIRFQNTFQCEHLASHGYVVIAPDHQGNTYFDASGNSEDLREQRPLDVLFVLDQFVGFAAQEDHRFAGWVDPSPGVGITGHSFGAYTSLAAASLDDRIVAALPMALGGPVSATYRAATLLMLATEDKTIGLDGNQGVRDTFALLSGPRFLSEIIDGGHYSFSFACQTGLGIGDGDGCQTATRFADDSEFTFTSDQRVWRAGQYLLGRPSSGAISRESKPTIPILRRRWIRRSISISRNPSRDDLGFRRRFE